MKCPKCAETIDDSSAFCPFCGDAVGQKFCAKCGGPNSQPSSTGKGLIVLCLILFGGGLIWLQLVRNQDTDGTEPTEALQAVAVAAPQLQKPYRILASEQTTFADHTVHTLSVRVNPYTKQSGILTTARDIAREKLLVNPTSVIDIRLFTTDEYLEGNDNWNARAIAVDFEKHPTYQFPPGNFEDVGDNVYIEWRDA